MGKTYMIGSQKGGTAKTTTTFNLAYCLRKMGKRGLAVYPELGALKALYMAAVYESA
jgi:MinD-like ATPase involved in chromosome partitioning or flagellar assembly